MLQQLDAEVGHSELLLALHSKWIHGLPLGEGSVDHLIVKHKQAVSISALLTTENKCFSKM